MIRKFEDKDIDKVMYIWLTSTIKGHEFISEEYWKNNYDAVKNIYIPMSQTFVYEDDANHQIKGFISILNNNFIGALFVDTSCQNQGIGSSLIDYVTLKYDTLELCVYKDNINAVNFYKNKGFSIISEQINDDSNFVEYIMKIEKLKS